MIEGVWFQRCRMGSMRARSSRAWASVRSRSPFRRSRRSLSLALWGPGTGALVPGARLGSAAFGFRRCSRSETWRRRVRTSPSSVSAWPRLSRIWRCCACVFLCWAAVCEEEDFDCDGQAGVERYYDD